MEIRRKGKRTNNRKDVDTSGYYVGAEYATFVFTEDEDVIDQTVMHILQTMFMSDGSLNEREGEY